MAPSYEDSSANHVDRGRRLAPDWPRSDHHVKQALESLYVTGDWGRYHGQQCEAFTAELCEYHQTEFAWLCCSGTIAIELALRGLDVRAGDEVVLAGYDFPGNFRAIESIGALPVLIDIDPATWCLNPELLPAAFSQRTRSVIVSHLHGGLAPMSRIVELCQASGISVVEDACQATGAALENQVAGTLADIGVLSFGGSKLMTSGRGGAILTSRADVVQRIKIFGERGNQAFPLSELQAAVLRPQLAQLDADNLKRAAQAELLIREIGDLASLTPVHIGRSPNRSSFYKFAFRVAVETSTATHSRDHIADHAQSRGLALHAGFRGFANRSNRRCRAATELVHSRHAADHTLILHHPVLLESDDVIREVAQILREAISGPDGQDPPTTTPAPTTNPR